MTAAGAEAVRTQFERTKDVLQEKLSADEYQSFLGSVSSSDPPEVDDALGHGIYDHDGALRAFATLWQIDPDRVE